MYRFAPAALICILVAAFFAFGLQRYVSFGALREHRDMLQQFVAEHEVTAVAVYIAAYAVMVALSLPGAAMLTVAGGFLFGTMQATAWAVLGATVGATGVFIAARSALGDALRRRVGNALGRMEAGFRANAFNYLLFLRLVPVFPFFLVNLVPAFLGIPLKTFVIGTFVGIIPGTFVYAQVGRGLDSILAAGGAPDLSKVLTVDVIIALTGLALLALLPVVIRRWRRRKP